MELGRHLPVFPETTLEKGIAMKQLISMLVAAIFAAASATAIAQQEKKAEPKKDKMEKSTATKDAPKKQQTAAQKKRQACNEQASERKLTGDERKKFVSSCAKPAAKTAKGEGKKKDEMKTK
jgi:hypothetical protein